MTRPDLGRVALILTEEEARQIVDQRQRQAFMAPPAAYAWHSVEDLMTVFPQAADLRAENARWHVYNEQRATHVQQLSDRLSHLRQRRRLSWRIAEFIRRQLARRLTWRAA